MTDQTSVQEVYHQISQLNIFLMKPFQTSMLILTCKMDNVTSEQTPSTARIMIIVSQCVNKRKMMWWWPCAALQQQRYVKKKKRKKRCITKSLVSNFCGTSFSPALSVCAGFWASESWTSSEYELQGSLNVTICGLQHPQHQLLVLDSHVPELLHLGLPASLQNNQPNTQSVWGLPNTATLTSVKTPRLVPALYKWLLIKNKSN